MSWLYVFVYAVLAAIIGAFVGAVAGVGVAGMVMRPEEAVVLVSGVSAGGPLGALTGLVVGTVVAVRRTRHSSAAQR